MIFTTALHYSASQPSRCWQPGKISGASAHSGGTASRCGPGTRNLPYLGSRGLATKRSQKSASRKGSLGSRSLRKLPRVEGLPLSFCNRQICWYILKQPSHAVVTGVTLLWQHRLPACPELESQQESMSPCVCAHAHVHTHTCVMQRSPPVGVLVTVFHFLWLAPFLSIHYLSYSSLSLPPPLC